jgi:hypothetical protein
MSCDKQAIKGALLSTHPSISPLSCMCAKGDFRLLEPPESNIGNSTYIGQCVPCPEGAKCSEPGITLETLPLQVGYWRSDKSSHRLVKCYTESACPQDRIALDKLKNSTNSTDSQCALGHQGPRCNVCMKGYAKSIVGLCEACSDNTFQIPRQVIFVFCAIVLIVILCFIGKKSLKPRKEKTKLDVFRMKASQEFSRESVHENALTKANNNRDHWFYRIRTKSKIMLTFLQILTSFETILDIRFPPLFEKVTRFIASTVNVDALKIAKVDCIMEINFHTSLLVQTLFPIALCVLILLIYLISIFTCGRNDVKKRDHYRNFATSLFLTMTFVVFASVSKTIFDTFNCMKIGDDPIRWLASDNR